MMVLDNLLLKALEPVIRQQVRKADFNRRFHRAVERALARFREQGAAADPAVVAFLLEDAPVLDLPSVEEALRELVLQPARADDRAQREFAAAVRRFAPTVPLERLDRTLALLVTCLRDELQQLPELQPRFLLMYQQRQTEILAGLSRPAVAPPAAATGNLPQRGYERFVGRTAELATIVTKMGRADRTWVVVIDGIGGVGKTSLALEAAHRLTDFDAVVWVSAKRTTLTANGIVTRQADFLVLRDVFEAIGAVCGRPDLLQLPENQQQTVVRTLLGGPRRVLLVLDNMETVDDERVTGFLHDLPQPAKAIVTSRHRIDVAFSIRLTGLASAESAELIRTEAAIRGVPLSDAEVAGLARKSGGVPLAIVWSLGLMSLGHSAESVLRRLGSGSGDIAEFCFARSIDELGGDALPLLAAAALFEGPVGRDLLGQAAGLAEDVVGRDDALQRLIVLSLVNHKGSEFSLLPLTRTFVRRHLAERPDLKRVVEDDWFAAVMRIAADYRGPDLMWRDRVRLRTVGPHLESAYAMALDQGRTASLVELARTLIAAYDMVGRWDDLVVVAAELEEYGGTMADADAVSEAVWALNWVYAQRGEMTAAWASLERARDQAVSPLHEVNYHVGHAQTSRRAGHLEEARRHVDAALMALPGIDPAAAPFYRGNILFERGKIARDGGDWDEADRWFTEASQVFDFDQAEDAIRDGRRPAFDLERTLGLLGNRALVERHRGNLATAAQMLERCLDFTREHGSLSNVATLLIRLAAIRLDQGRADETKVLVTEGQAIAAQTGMREELAESQRLLGLLGG